MPAITRRDFLRQSAGRMSTAFILAGGGLGSQGCSWSSLLGRMSLEDKIGQLMCDRLGADNVESLVAEGRVGSLYGLLGRRGSAREAADFLNHLQTIAKYPLLIVGEQEQGNVRNFPGGTEFPAYMAFGAARSRELAFLFGRINTVEGRAVGYNWISCPTLDVNIEPSNPIINTRALGDLPDLVTELGLESCRAIVENRGLTCICHFPGHGATSGDSHIEMPVVSRSREELLAVELAPYRAGIPAGFMNCIMTAHNAYPALEPQAGLPATLSSNIMTRLLREELHYDGLIATDGLGMKAISAHFAPADAAVRAIMAGCDILLAGDQEASFHGLKEAVEKGVLPVSRLDASVRRIVEAKKWLGLFEMRTVDAGRVDEVVGCAEHRSAARRVARESVTRLRRQVGPPLKGRGLLVLSSASWCDLAAGQGNADEHVFREMRGRNPEARTISLGVDGAGWADARSAARQSQAIVMAVATKVRGYAEASRRANMELFALAREIAGVGRPTSLLMLGDPYAVKHLPASADCICAYSNCADSVAAAVEILFDEIGPKGKLPISISRDYPYGFGLS